MRIITNILITFLIVISNQVYSCDCKSSLSLDSLRKISYNYADLVFLGELVDFDTTDFSYTFRIIEIFKGETNVTLIKGKIYNSCSKFPEDKCKWIIYTKIRDTNIINIDICTVTRSELNPSSIFCYDHPCLLGPNATSFEIEKYNELETAINEKAKKDWIEEIEILRNWRL